MIPNVASGNLGPDFHVLASPGPSWQYGRVPPRLDNPLHRSPVIEVDAHPTVPFSGWRQLGAVRGDYELADVSQIVYSK